MQTENNKIENEQRKMIEQNIIEIINKIKLIFSKF